MWFQRGYRFTCLSMDLLALLLGLPQLKDSLILLLLFCLTRLESVFTLVKTVDVWLQHLFSLLSYLSLDLDFFLTSASSSVLLVMQLSRSSWLTVFFLLLGSRMDLSKDLLERSQFDCPPSLTYFFSDKQQLVVALLCLFASRHFCTQSGSRLRVFICPRMSLSMGILLKPMMMPSVFSLYLPFIQGWLRIWSILYRSAWLPLSTLEMRSLAGSESDLCRLQVPAVIFLYKDGVSGSSKGRQPHSMAKRMTPQDQISTRSPSYFSPLIISGAAQQGDPHGVLSCSPFLQVLESPKSTILTDFLQSRSMFSGLRSRWTMPILWMYSMPAMSWQKMRTASASPIRLLSTMQSKSSPFSMYSMTRNNCLGVSMISQSCTMLGCLISLRMWISLETRSTSATSVILLFSRIFMATCWLVGLCTADLTLPKVPSPIVLPDSHYTYRSGSRRTTLAPCSHRLSASILIFNYNDIFNPSLCASAKPTIKEKSKEAIQQLQRSLCLMILQDDEY